MGRASRQKNERHNDRTWSTINPWTGRDEQFTVHLTDTALAEWERDRVYLKGRGYPDRPPEIDTPTSRSWGVGGPPRRPAELMLGSDRSAQALGTWSIVDESQMLMVHLGLRPDGELILDIRAGRADAPTRYFARGVKSVMIAGQIARGLAERLGLPEPGFVSAEEVVADLVAARAARTKVA
jgi:hypothetical protein